jgi:hypothetical protein
MPSSASSHLQRAVTAICGPSGGEMEVKVASGLLALLVACRCTVIAPQGVLGPLTSAHLHSRRSGALWFVRGI